MAARNGDERSDYDAIDNSPEAQSLYNFWNQSSRPTVPDIMQAPSGPIEMTTYEASGITPNTGVPPNTITPDSGAASVIVFSLMT